MNINNICLNCMREKSSNGTCPYCSNSNNIKAPSHHIKPGSILNGKYLIGKALGEGGFGITYFGLDLNLNYKVAIKEYYPHEFAKRADANTNQVRKIVTARGDYFGHGKERFLDEAKTLVKFNSKPGVVSVKDFFDENGTAYLVMEYIDGTTLQKYLKQAGGKLESEKVFSLLSPLMKTLSQIHSQGLIHRDISPDNIMITTSGVLKLLDFGSSRSFLNAGNKSLSVLLKPGFAPIEQYDSKGLQGPWTDVYSLCATMYKCITGVVPEDALGRMRSGRLKRPSEFSVRIDRRKEEVLLKGLEIEHKNRIQSMNELLSGLSQVENTSQHKDNRKSHKPKSTNNSKEDYMQNNQGKNRGNTTFFENANNGSLSLKDIFSGTFKNHDKATAEKLLMAGTVNNTPPPSQMLNTWIKPWVYFRALIASCAICFLFYLLYYVRPIYALVPLVFIGCLVMPLCLVIFFYELNIPMNITFYSVISMILVGGFASLCLTFLFSSFIDISGAQWAAITEEPAKILAICIFLRKPKKYYILNGILIGSAIGAGFAFIESAGYALRFDDIMMQTILLRGLFSTGCHVIWAAIEGGIIAKAMNGRKFTISYLFNPECILFFLITMALHFTWNYDFTILYVPFVLDVKYILLIIIAWLVLLKVISMGINEVLLVSQDGIKVQSKNQIPIQNSATRIEGISGYYKGQSIPLGVSRMTMGRDSKVCNLVFPKDSSKISRSHCTLYFQNGELFIQDNSSRNGTFNSDKKLSDGAKMKLNVGTVFYLGDKANSFVVK